MFKKYWPLIVAFFAGIISVLAISTRTEEKGKPFDVLIAGTKEELDKLNEKEDNIKKGVEEKTPEEEIEYWKKN